MRGSRLVVRLSERSTVAARGRLLGGGAVLPAGGCLGKARGQSFVSHRQRPTRRRQPPTPGSPGCRAFRPLDGGTFDHCRCSRQQYRWSSNDVPLCRCSGACDSYSGHCVLDTRAVSSSSRVHRDGRVLSSKMPTARRGITPKSWTHQGVLHLGNRWYVVSATLDAAGIASGVRLDGPYPSRKEAEAIQDRRPGP
jgi:hypothetical protein